MKKLLLFFSILICASAALGQGVIVQGDSAKNVDMRGFYKFKYLTLPKISGAPTSPSNKYQWGLRGLIVLDTTFDKLYVYTNNGWNEIHLNAGDVSADYYSAVASSMQTVFTPTFAIPAPAKYYQVFVNGIKISSGFTNNTSNITFSSGRTAGDKVEIQVLGYGASSGGGGGGTVTAANFATTGNVLFSDVSGKVEANINWNLKVKDPQNIERNDSVLANQKLVKYIADSIVNAHGGGGSDSVYVFPSASSAYMSLGSGKFYRLTDDTLNFVRVTVAGPDLSFLDFTGSTGLDLQSGTHTWLPHVPAAGNDYAGSFNLGIATKKLASGAVGGFYVQYTGSAGWNQMIVGLSAANTEENYGTFTTGGINVSPDGFLFSYNGGATAITPALSVGDWVYFGRKVSGEVFVASGSTPNPLTMTQRASYGVVTGILYVKVSGSGIGKIVNFHGDNLN